jgi:nickel-dependent lactate racemase
MTKINLNYGRGSIPIEIDESWEAEIIRKPKMPIVPEPRRAVQKALLSPSSGPSLREVARNKESACILICDITRPVPNGLLLPEIVSELMTAGIPRTSIKILVATGLHRPNLGDELSRLIGDKWILENIEIINHNAKKSDEHVLVGTTSKGTVVRLDRRFVDAEVKIVTGLVEPHFMAGYSGGRKVIAPGIAHEETITTFHNHKFMSDPYADSCILVGNPLHEEQTEIVSMLGPVYCVNTVLDEYRNLSYVNFGEIISSHLESVNFAQEYLSVTVARRFQTIVTSAAGYPLDQTYYQTVKGMVTPYKILQPGGDLIIVSDCSEGLGSSEYKDAQRRLIKLGYTSFCESIAKKDYASVDEWQTQMQTKAMKVGNINLYTTGLNEADRELTGVNMISDINEFIRHCAQRNKNTLGETSLAIIPEGPYVVPRLQD